MQQSYACQLNTVLISFSGSNPLSQAQPQFCRSIFKIGERTQFRWHSQSYHPRNLEKARSRSAPGLSDPWREVNSRGSCTHWLSPSYPRLPRAVTILVPTPARLVAGWKMEGDNNEMLRHSISLLSDVFYPVFTIL